MVNNHQANTKKGQKAELVFKNCRDWIGFGFAAVVIVVFLLVFHNYSDIESIKLGFIIACTVTALGLLILAGVQALMNGVRIKVKSFSEFWSGISISQKLLALYLLFCIVSYFTSPYSGIADLWGGTSRGGGVRTQLLFGAIFFITANCARKHTDWLFLGFTGAVMAFSIIGLLQAFGLGFGSFTSQDAAQGFYTTVGNKNMVSAVLCMALAALAGALTVWEDKRRSWLIGPFLLTMWFMFVIENDSGIVGIGALLVVLPILCWNTPERVSRGLFTYALVAVDFFLWRILPFSNGSGTAPIITFGTSAALGLCVAAVLFVLSWVVKALSPKIMLTKKGWTILCAVLILVLLVTAVAVFLNVELGQQNGFLYELQEILRGNLNDSFGSGRIYVWKRSLALLPHTPLFGFGPDCFYLAFNEVNYYESTYVNHVLFDFAHNEYIQTVINYGWPGLISYLAVMISIAIRAIRKKEQNSFIIVFGLSAFTYCVQAFFSFAHMVMTPIFWALLGLTESSIYTTNVERKLKIQ